jgi:hypothetical protein
MVVNRDNTMPAGVCLRFPLSSVMECVEGPINNLVPEHMMPCFLEDMLALQLHGVIFRVETYNV